MPYTTGIATSNVDLIDKTIDFLTGSAMTAAGQAWTSLGRATDQTTGGWVRGPGLAGGENIYVGLRAADTPASDVYNIEVAGSLGFSTSLAWSAQVGKSPLAYSCGWNTSTPYWIVANGQRFVVVFKVSTTYHAIYAGKILPYGTPSQYGYPVFIGGETDSATLRWSDTTPAFRHFVDPGAPLNGNTSLSGAYLCYPDGSWQQFKNWFTAGGVDSQSTSGRSIWPYQGDATDSSNVADRHREIRDNVDGSYTLFPLILQASSPGKQVFGEFDGCYFVSGHNNAAENIITVGGADHLVVQNIFRTNRWNYWALKLA